jgi:replicative DNA helicase
MEVALRGHGVLFVSLEMSEAEIIDRILSNLGHIPLDHLVAQTLTEYDARSAEAARQKLEEAPLDIIDDQSITLSKIRSAARAKARTPEGLSLLIVDYLGLLAPADSPKDRNRLVEAVSRGLKVLARDLGIRVVAAHQLNREGARRRNPRPVLSDFRDSGAVEQDADIACLLYRPEEGSTVEQGVDPNELEVIVAKNRQGPKRIIRLHFNGAQARVGSMARFDLIQGGE